MGKGPHGPGSRRQGFITAMVATVTITCATSRLQRPASSQRSTSSTGTVDSSRLGQCFREQRRSPLPWTEHSGGGREISRRPASGVLCLESTHTQCSRLTRGPSRSQPRSLGGERSVPPLCAWCRRQAEKRERRRPFIPEPPSRSIILSGRIQRGEQIRSVSGSRHSGPKTARLLVPCGVQYRTTCHGS